MGVGGNGQGPSQGQQRAGVKAEAVRRLSTMRKGKRQYLDAVWPGDEQLPDSDPEKLHFKMAVLSCTEIRDCHFAAYHEFVRANVDPTQQINIQMFEDEVITQVLSRACLDRVEVSPGVFGAGEPIASSAEDMRDATTADERTAVFDLYMAWQSEVDPAPEAMNPELLREILALVKKKDRLGLKGLGLNLLVNFMLSTADQPPSSATGKSEASPSS